MKRNTNNVFTAAIGLFFADCVIQVLLNALSAGLVLNGVLSQQNIPVISIVCVIASSWIAAFLFCRKVSDAKLQILLIGQSLYLLLRIILLLSTKQAGTNGSLFEAIGICAASVLALLISNLKKPAKGRKQFHKMLLKKR